MSFENQMQKAVLGILETAISEALERVKPKEQESTGLITTGQAAKLLACSGEYVRSLQDKGALSLVFLPGSNHRRVLRSELDELIKKNTVRPKKKAVS